MCKQVCHTVRENALTMNCSLIFKSKRQYIVHLFFYFCSLTIKDKTKISLTIKILHLGQGSFTRKVRTIFTLKIIVSIFVKLFLILVLHLRQFFIVRIFVKRATEFRQFFFWLIHRRQCWIPLRSCFQFSYGRSYVPYYNCLISFVGLLFYPKYSFYWFLIYL